MKKGDRVRALEILKHGESRRVHPGTEGRVLATRHLEDREPEVLVAFPGVGTRSVAASKLDRV